MRVEASDKLSRMPLSFIDSHAHGDLMSRVVNDVDQVGDGLLQALPSSLPVLSPSLARSRLCSTVT